ncbi:MAG: hypothetical protein U9Q83_06855 [Bacteroidota bacterium]|nr:hypothetical protein [Bacteroidota bacterium]
MKKIIYSLTLVSFMFILFSCGNTEENIIGTWKVKEVALQNIDDVIDQIIEDELDGEEVEQSEIDDFKVQLKEELEEDFVDDFSDDVKVIEFKDDGTALFSDEEAEWTLGDDDIIKLKIDGIEKVVKKCTLLK